MIFIIGIFVSIFLAILLFSKSGRKLPDRILAIWLLIIGIHIFTYYSFSTGLIYRYNFLIGLNFPFPFLHGPILYIYTLSITQPERPKLKIWLGHFVLPLVVLASTVSFLLLPMDQKIYVFRNEGEGYETFLLSINVILSLSGLTYIYITNKLLLKHRHRILQEFSYKEKINLDWLQFLFFGMGLIWISIILNLSDNWIFTLATLFVIFIGYFGISQSNIFNYQQPENIGSESEIILDDQGDGLDTKRKYAKSGLTKSSSEDLHHRLTLLMRQHRLYREPGLTLVELANRLDIHPNYLSQVINEIEKNNFYDYINGLRIEEFKKEIIKAENKKYTLIYVAFDCGFNSKSAFNRYFKKIEGQSPTEFLKSYENENL